MSSYEFNIHQLEAVAAGLEDLLPMVTFLGGCTTALLVDESAHFGVRQTKDVDVIIDVTTYVGYQSFSKKLREKGFVEDVDGPNCRWLFRSELATIQLDVMPIDEDALGFANRWYPDAIKNSFQHKLDSGIQIAVASPVYFLATKFEAFDGRGEGDYFSHDIEDIVFVLENSSDIINKILASPLTLKEYLAERMGNLLNDRFLNVLPGILNSHESVRAVENILRIISGKPWR